MEKESGGEYWRVGVVDHVHPWGELFHYSNTPDFIREVRLLPKSQQLNLARISHGFPTATCCTAR